MSDQVWYLLGGIAVVLVVLALIFRTGKVKGTVEALGVKAGLEGSGPEKDKPAASPSPAAVSATNRGIAVGGNASGHFSTGDDRKG